MQCYACKNKIREFDYKEPGLAKHISGWGRIKTRRETRLCARHQRKLTSAIKRARFLALLPYTNK